MWGGFRTSMIHPFLVGMAAAARDLRKYSL